MTDKIAGVEFAGLENDGLEHGGVENDKLSPLTILVLLLSHFSLSLL